MLSGIGPDTPLGRIVAIRSETDKNVLKHFTRDQKRIRSEWMARRAKAKTESETATFIEQMKQMFIRMAGEGEKN